MLLGHKNGSVIAFSSRQEMFWGNITLSYVTTQKWRRHYGVLTKWRGKLPNNVVMGFFGLAYVSFFYIFIFFLLYICFPWQIQLPLWRNTFLSFQIQGTHPLMLSQSQLLSTLKACLPAKFAPCLFFPKESNSHFTDTDLFKISLSLCHLAKCEFPSDCNRNSKSTSKTTMIHRIRES